ncbi:MAG: sodium-dependent bicarbonate transport family permease [Hydrogenophaga sp.]|uniref:sodium-dependent bicarbonate transport family permease n=1 Tax=Hydrogenophaga sp. TaxID=1904254 RepID=UPI0015F3F5BF|nr:sodium-dependent bicarbonate transport family permease [Hydrogenophaga sp.]MBS3910661.1 sodium-dependent bicarbonate transport family permease [Hydrogenophaga sp.]MDO9148570.1 sodium-dependent bicarbonate transport family permease [Hydrogenophaga sp.]MDO9605438.1 sodium-dependent bicarbonate transport family permease [Hydrogenophaga sp.]MDP2165215.1 sodium-dependent bicarbonate transport family permease [Hydrogenophaga sp.]|mmetsp:Transcript_38692/g.90450  ORF Transcript_38692/g.90450 Transcript_38692/m.90450 type:complete len:331 (-) Transcript_38692:4941-5933(-)
MNAGVFSTLLDPAILFFILGLFAAAVRSNLEIPAQISKFLSLYLLMAIGLKGGMALSVSGIQPQILLGLGIALLMAFLVPAYTYPLLRLRTDGYNAAAVAATYGSVSAVTFIAAGQFLNNQGVEFGGYMAVALVLMESPAIIMAVALAAHARGQANLQSGAVPGAAGDKVSMKSVLHEAFTDGGHLLLLGSLVVGTVVGVKGYEVMKPFTGDIFKGLLAFFLLEMGLLVARRLREMKGIDPFFVGFAFVVPMVNALITIGLAHWAGLSDGDTLMLAVLAASASYIVVPAVVRAAIPEANPGIYFSMSLAMTFPFNVIIGIPLYYQLVVYL